MTDSAHKDFVFPETVMTCVHDMNITQRGNKNATYLNSSKINILQGSKSENAAKVN